MMLRQILILIISALVLFFSYRYYSDDFCPSCCTNVENVSSIGAAATSPLLFKNQGGMASNKGIKSFKNYGY